MTADWGWPQWTWLVLAILSLLIAASEHGKPRTPHSFPMTVVAFGIGVFILASGGFFP